MATKINESRTEMNVIAKNDFNRPFGIEGGNVYRAVRVVEAWATDSVTGNGTFETTSYDVDGVNYSGDDFAPLS